VSRFLGRRERLPERLPAKQDNNEPMKAALLTLLTAVLISPVLLARDDTPSGYMPLDKLAEAQIKAKQSKKLIAITAKGSDDKCPYCAAAFAEGTKALRSDCVMVFTRVAALREKRDTVPAALKEASATAADGAAIYFYVFDADISQLVTTTDRMKLQNDPKNIKETKKVVNEAQKKLATASSKLSGLKR
jgi:hypothetical protein